jgi:Uma2 family endonuclease
MAVQQLPKTIVYPESDGQPMADNTRQLEYIVYLYDNLSALFADREEVFVAADLLWYPVEGHPEICAAPDVFVVFGRPKGHRGRYLQWEEGNIPPHVVFEILSPSNRHAAMVEKSLFYERYGVQEYYMYDPDTGALDGWIRQDGKLVRVAQMEGWVSPLLGVRFTVEDGALVVYRPDGERFVPYVELRRRYERAQWEAEQERRRAEQERLRAEEAERRAERLAQRLREMGVDPEQLA